MKIYTKRIFYHFFIYLALCSTLGLNLALGMTNCRIVLGLSQASILQEISRLNAHYSEMSNEAKNSFNELSGVSFILNNYEHHVVSKNVEFADEQFEKMLQIDARKTALKFYYHDFDFVTHDHVLRLQQILIHQFNFFAKYSDNSHRVNDQKFLKKVPSLLHKAINKILERKMPSYWSRSPETTLRKAIHLFDAEALASQEFADWVAAINAEQNLLDVNEK